MIHQYLFQLIQHDIISNGIFIYETYELKDE